MKAEIGMVLKNRGNHQKIGERYGIEMSQPLEGTKLADTMILGLYNTKFLLLKIVCGGLLRQP